MLLLQIQQIKWPQRLLLYSVSDRSKSIIRLPDMTVVKTTQFTWTEMLVMVWGSGVQGAVLKGLRKYILQL